MADQATLTKRLAEAEEALHQLLMGRQVVQVQSGDDVVRYERSNIATLRAYVASLKAQLGQTPERRRAVRPFF